MKKIFWIGVLLAGLSSTANAALIGIMNGNAAERDALVATLTSLGHTVTTTIDGSLDLIISAPGNATSTFAGVPYLQISDHGADNLVNAWATLTAGTPVTVTLTGAHPILTGVSPTWTTLGFWQYGSASDYVGYVTGVPGIANATAAGTTYNDTLAVSGNTDIYIGWNVYGPNATPDDILLLSNAIQFLVTGNVVAAQSVAVPTLSEVGLFILVLLLLTFSYRRAKAF